MAEGPGADGNGSDLPWVSVFDPALNIRALGEIQARGFRAATEIVNRFVRMADTNSGADKRCGSVFTSAEYFEHAFAGAEPGPDLDFLQALVPYVWARWR